MSYIRKDNKTARKTECIPGKPKEEKWQQELDMKRKRSSQDKKIHGSDSFASM